MRKIKYTSLALTFVPLVFMGCTQEKISKITPSIVNGNYVQASSSTIEKSINAKDSSNKIISESELDKLVALVQKKLAEEPTPKVKSPKISTLASISITPIETVTEETLIDESEIPTKETFMDEELFEEASTEDSIPDAPILSSNDDTNSDLDELTKLVANGLNTEIKGVEGVYSTPIVMNEENIHKKFMIEVEDEIEAEKTEKTEPEVKEKAKEKIAEISKESEIVSTAIAFLDTKYIWAANGPTAFDCSGFTKYVFKENGVTLPRYSGNQAKVGKPIAYKELHVGDLVFFNTEKKYKQKVNHVGIYIGDNKFIHASSAKKKVVITSFKKKPFYKKRFLWGQRVIKDHSVYASL